MKNISYKIRLTLACVLLSATSVQLIAQTNNDILKQADRHYQYANYARAVQLYEQDVAYMFRVDRVDRDCLILPWIDVKAPPETSAFIVVPFACVKYVEMAFGWFVKIFFLVNCPFNVAVDFRFRVIFVCFEFDS